MPIRIHKGRKFNVWQEDHGYWYCTTPIHRGIFIQGATEQDALEHGYEALKFLKRFYKESGIPWPSKEEKPK
jgi:predicted RNase H-like HicB family nuclease